MNKILNEIKKIKKRKHDRKIVCMCEYNRKKTRTKNETMSEKIKRKCMSLENAKFVGGNFI